MVLCMNLRTKYCCKSLNKQSSGVQERINPFYIDSYGKNGFGLRTFRVTNGLQERIKFLNRGFNVLHIHISPSTSSAQRNCASWASQPQKSVTLRPQPGGETPKSEKKLPRHRVQTFL